MPIFDAASTFAGFGSFHGGIATLVFIDATQCNEWQWGIQISSLLAVGLPDGGAALRWTNERNRVSVYGRRYVLETPGFGIVVIHEEFLPGAHFLGAFVNGSDLAGYLQSLTQVLLQEAEEEAANLQGAVGGHGLPATEETLLAVFGMASG